MSEGVFYAIAFNLNALRLRRLPTKTPSIAQIEQLVGGPYGAVKAFDYVIVMRKGAKRDDPVYLFRGSGVPGDNLYGFTKTQATALIKKELKGMMQQ